MACCVNPVQDPNKLGSIGMPLPDVEVRIVDADDSDRDWPSAKSARCCFGRRSTWSSTGTTLRETAETLRTHGAGGPWVHTGDLARMDEEGFIFIVDRKKDMLKTNGFQVWPREIEEVLDACTRRSWRPASPAFPTP